MGKIQYIAGERKLSVLNAEYTEKVVLTLLVPGTELELVEKAITEGTNGRARMRRDRVLYFADLNGQIMTFEE